MLLLALVLAFAPPPPAPVPDGLAAPVDGYDLREPFQIWRAWVEAQKGAATQALLSQPETVAGHEPIGEPIIRFEKYNDFGLFLTGEIRSYCPRTANGGIRSESCHYRLRRAYVSDDGGGYDDNPVARWTREAFDAPRLAAHLRVLGLPANTDWWRADRAQMFAVLPSAVPMLMQNATVVRMDSRECPALQQALRHIQTQRISLDVDLPTVHPDQRVTGPPPHAVRIVYTLRSLASAADEGVTIRGNGSMLREMIHPVLDAADACERRRAQ